MSAPVRPPLSTHGPSAHASHSREVGGSIISSAAIVRVPHVTILHGDGRPPNSRAYAREPHRFECLQPPTERFGTHHSKAIFIIRPQRLTVVVVTANFIFSDWHNKTVRCVGGSPGALPA